MDRLDWDDDEIKTRLRGKASVRGGRIRIVGVAAIELPAHSVARRCRELPPPRLADEDDAATTQPIRRLSLEHAGEVLTEHVSVMVAPAQVSDAGAPSHEVEVCALVPVQSRPHRIDVSLDIDDFLEDWEVDVTDPMTTDPAATRPRGSLVAGQLQSSLLLDVASRHAPFEVWPEEDAAVAAREIARMDRRHLEEDDAPLGLAPDSWVPEAEKPSRRVGTLTPLVAPRSERRTGGWLALATLLALAVVGTWYLWPRAGSLRVELAEQESVPEVAVFVDGVRRCESTPCIVRDLRPGSHLVKLVAHGHLSPAASEHAVQAGQETLVELALADAAQGVELTSAHAGVRVEVDGSDRGTLPVTIGDLAVGEHRLRFSAAGHRTVEKRVEVAAGELTNIEVKLEALPPRLRIELTPADASVELRKSGERKRHAGRWPRTVELDKGEWEIVAFRHGYIANAQKIVLGEGEQTVRIKLTPMADDGDIYWR